MKGGPFRPTVRGSLKEITQQRLGRNRCGPTDASVFAVQVGPLARLNEAGPEERVGTVGSFQHL
jgi:hypothetical protein